MGLSGAIVGWCEEGCTITQSASRLRAAITGRNGMYNLGVGIEMGQQRCASTTSTSPKIHLQQCWLRGAPALGRLYKAACTDVLFKRFLELAYFLTTPSPKS